MAGAMAAVSTTVDLSRLPAPEIVVQLDFETILAEMVADVQVLQPSFDATVDSDPAVKVLQVAAYRELLLRRAFQEGALQNFVAYASDTRLDHLAALVGVTRLTVTPADPLTGTGAIMEADDDLRQRVVLAPESFTVAGPELAYVARAKEASADVLDASATSPSPGNVLVSVLARDGDGTASPALIALVEAVVTDKGVRPLGDRVTVASTELVPFTVIAAIRTFAGPDAALIVAAARTALDTYLAENRRLGRDVTRSGLYAALTVAGVQRVDLALPLGDINCTATQTAHCTAIALTHAGYAD